MTPATAEKKLELRQARALHDADVEVANLQVALEDAEARRKTLRERYHERVPLSDDPAERAKGIREVVVGGFTVRIAPMVSGETFSISGYRKAGHDVTAEMEEFIGGSKPYNRWTVKGPRKKSNAVEPT